MMTESSNLPQSIIVALCVAIGNIIAAVLSFRKALRSTDIQNTLSIVITSMVARVVCMLAALWFGIKVWKLHQIAFSLTLLSAYLLSMSVEIVVIHFQQLKRERQLQHDNNNIINVKPNTPV